MALSPRSVLIPLVGSEDAGGRMARIQADGTAPPTHEAGLDSCICQLADWRLYEAGAIALGAFKRLQLPPRRLALLQRLRPTAHPAFLSVTNGPDIVGLHSEANKSAELGLALCLAMYTGQSGARAVIATGSLSHDATPRGLMSNDVDVLPVEGLKAKIETVKASIEMYKGGAFPKQVFFFLPQMTGGGEETAVQYAAEIDALIERFDKHGITMEVTPVATLRDATTKLGIRSLEISPADKAFSVGIAAMLFLGGMAAITFFWLSASLALAFGEVALASNEVVATPLRAYFDREQHRLMAQASCLGEQKMPIYRAGDFLVLQIGIGNWSDWTQRLGGYHFVVVTVSEESGLKVFPPRTFRRGTSQAVAASTVSGTVETTKTPTGAELSVVLPIEGPTEENKIIILARKLRPFDTDAIRQGLKKATSDIPKSQVINAAVNFLEGEAPGYLDYSFLSTEDLSACADR